VIRSVSRAFFHLSLKVPVKRALLQVPQHYGERCLFLEPLYLSLGGPNNQCLLIKQNLTFKFRGKEAPPLHGPPVWREMPFYRAVFYASLGAPTSKGSVLSQSPQRSLDGAPVERERERETVSRAVVHSFIHSYLPIKELSHEIRGKHVTFHGAPRGRKTCIQWGAAWFPSELLTTLLLLSQCHAGFSAVSSTMAWFDQSPVSQSMS